tara:strand:- start:265 stop:735 length:471 start_codon:yes stop_codon:yes gene_type:complete
MITKVTKKGYQLRMGVVIFAFIAPILYILHGPQPSLSSYWNTEMQPLFILANAATSFYLYQIKNWRPSALMLLLLTAFSLDLYPSIHNGLAILFFIVTLYPLGMTNHYKWIICMYVGSLGVLPFSMLGAEIIAIWALCLHQLLMLRKLYKLNSRNG